MLHAQELKQLKRSFWTPFEEIAPGRFVSVYLLLQSRNKLELFQLKKPLNLFFQMTGL